MSDTEPSILERQPRLYLIGFVAAVYVVSGRLGQALAIPPGNITALWPPSGFALAMFLLFGKRIWPGVWIGALIANVWPIIDAGTVAVANRSLLAGFGIATGSTLQALVGSLLLHRVIPGRSIFNRFADAMKFSAVTPCICLISSTLGVTSLFVCGLIPLDNIFSAWSTWWIGDSGGVQIVTPAVISWVPQLHARWNRTQRIEAIALCVSIVTVSLVAFYWFHIPEQPLEFGILPLIAWAAFRFGQREVSTGVLLVNIVAFWGIIHHGDLGTPLPNLALLLQLKMIGFAMTGLVIGGVSTERQTTLEALHKSEVKYREFIEGTHDLVVQVDHQGKCVYLNSATSSFFGYPAGGCMGRVALDFVHPDDRARAQAALQEWIRGGIRFATFEGRSIHVQGDVHDLLWTINLSYDANGIVQLNLIGRNITERKRAEAEIQAAKNAVEKALVAKSRFLDIAAHELRTPATAMSILLQLTHRKLQRGQLVTADILEPLRAQTDRLCRLVVDLLDVSHLERGTMAIHPERVDLIDLISRALAETQVRAVARHFTFSRSDDLGNSAFETSADPIRIAQVLANLLDNAVKYTPEDSPVEVAAEANGDNLRVSVTDHGTGISKELQEQLFEPFTRGTTDQIERTTGLGLGLFVCRSIIELHGGTIGVSSDLGHGSTFYFELKRKEFSPCRDRDQNAS